MTIFDYIWQDKNGDIRSKKRVLKNTLLRDLPEWTFDGSSTGQQKTETSDLILKPVRHYIDPINDNNYIVLCEVYNTDNTPHESNYRNKLISMVNYDILNQDLLFGLEQEYLLFDLNNKPYGWYDHNMPKKSLNIEQGEYYCGVGGNRTFGRNIAEEHLNLCIKARLNICGINAEVMPSQWEFQLGPSNYIDICDELIIARYLLHRITEKYNCYVSFHPKPYVYNNKDIWNGSGCHINFSSNKTRENIKYIYEDIEKLKYLHPITIKEYGENNELRLTGNFETSSYYKFTFGETNRNSSIRIPINVLLNKKGYLEDRRPAANINPYRAIRSFIYALYSPLL